MEYRFKDTGFEYSILELVFCHRNSDEDHGHFVDRICMATMVPYVSPLESVEDFAMVTFISNESRYSNLDG